MFRFVMPFFVIEFPGFLSDVRHFASIGAANHAASFLGPKAKVRLRELT